MWREIINIVFGFILDLIFGDPYFMPHPVKFIGNLIRKVEKFLRSHENSKLLFFIKDRDRRQKFLGLILWIITVGTSFLVVFLINFIAFKISKILFFIVNVYFLYSALASKCLAFEGNKIYKSLEEKDLDKSRLNLSYIVGRETKELTEDEIIKATVETIAENTVDGITSPLFYAFIGSFFGLAAPLAYAYKAINTLDSMVGYKNEKYENYGFFSAKIDDIFNYIPARITGLLMVFSSFLLKLDFKSSFKILIRDRRNHKSPNCAYSEAPVAGALGIKLGGTHIYFGKTVYKPTIGDKKREPENKDIIRTKRIMYLTAIIFLIIGIVISNL
ncbi:MAG: adenosylcobinamide-phosphate synthase CbiB [Sarcina sp.]